MTYCLDVLLQFLAVPWSKDLHDLVAATKKHRVTTASYFADCACAWASTTPWGSTSTANSNVAVEFVYTGTAEVLAAEASELGANGQIVMTRRIAE
ncbi:unnamed protein product [Hyaloperonospora brassicae]|nr:unnamed protein product [Hyaloperonospora brassicae]